MKLTISERINKSKMKSEWDSYYWIIYVTDNKKKVYYKHWNKMFDLEPFLKTLIKTYIITEVRCVHSTPECVHALFNGTS